MVGEGRAVHWNLCCWAYIQQCVRLVICSTEDKIISFLHVGEKHKAWQILGGWETEPINISK